MCDESKEGKSLKREYQKLIKELYKKMESAPESYKDVVIEPTPENSTTTDNAKHTPMPQLPPTQVTQDMIKPFVFSTDNYNQNRYDLRIDEGQRADDLCINCNSNSNDIQRISFNHWFYQGVKNLNVRTKHVPGVMDGFDFTRDEAVKIAKPYVEALDPTLVLIDVGDAIYTDFSKDDRPSYPFGYTLYYARRYNGVDTNCAEDWSFCKERTAPDLYSKPCPQEYLTLTIGKQGVHRIKYTSPLEIISMNTNNVELLDWDKIMEKFKSNIVLNKKMCIDSDLFININKIQLGMMRIAKPDSDEYLVIPVWDFYGGAIISSSRKEYTDDEYWNMITDFHGRSLLTINAIDGLIINREMGY